MRDECLFNAAGGSLVDANGGAFLGSIDIDWLGPAGYPPMWLISTLVTPVVSDVRVSE